MKTTKALLICAALCAAFVAAAPPLMAQTRTPAARASTAALNECEGRLKTAEEQKAAAEKSEEACKGREAQALKAPPATLEETTKPPHAAAPTTPGSRKSG